MCAKRLTDGDDERWTADDNKSVLSNDPRQWTDDDEKPTA